MRLLSIASAALLLSASLAARADTGYTYTGKDFTSAEAPYTTSDSVTGSFTLTAPLGDSLNFDEANPLSFSFSDGVQTFDSSNTSYAEFEFSTNSNGQIMAYDIFLVHGPGEIDVSLNPEGFNGDTAFAGGNGSGISNTAGSFTTTTIIAATPEPSSLALFGTGILGVAGMVKRCRTWRQTRTRTLV